VSTFSASGFGMDAGAVLHPAQLFDAADDSWLTDLSLGVGIGNLLRPTLRLDQESVSDPTVARAGVAWRHLVGMRALTLAMDLEQAAGEGTSARLGGEFRINPQFALRAGVNGGTMTAGTGVSWHDLALDYAFEARGLDAVHRVSLVFGFGSTVVESRAAAEHAEEAKLQARLNDEFQRRQVEQVDALLIRARERKAPDRSTRRSSCSPRPPRSIRRAPKRSRCRPNAGDCRPSSSSKRVTSPPPRWRTGGPSRSCRAIPYPRSRRPAANR
jgi:hypothetical protein